MSSFPVTLAFEHEMWGGPHKIVGLGTITRGTSGNFRSGQYYGSKSSEYLQWMWQRYDAEFDSRNDYRLWRIVAVPHFLENVTWGAERPATFASAGLVEDTKPVIVWGILSCLARVFRDWVKGKELEGKSTVAIEQDWVQQRRRIFALFTEAEMRNLAHQCRGALGTVPVDHLRAECACIGTMAMDATQQLRHALKDSMGLAEARSYLEQLADTIRKWDPPWQPGGRPPSQEALKKERDETKSAIAPFAPDELASGMCSALFHARFVASTAVRREKVVDDVLLQDAFLFALSAWKNTRSFRKGESDWRERTAPRAPERSLAKLWLNEVDALYAAAQAARDAGDHLANAGLGALLLRAIPDGVLEDPEIGPALRPRLEEIADRLGFSIRQAGLEVDSRFVPTQEPVPDHGIREPAQRVLVTLSTRERAVGLASPPDDEWELFTYHVQQDQAGASWGPIWAVVWARHTEQGLLPLEQLDDEIRGGVPLSQDILQSALKLNLRYGRINKAGRAFEVMEVREEDILDFAHAVKRASQVMPCCVDFVKLNEWQEAIRSKWCQMVLGRPVAFRFNEVLLLHELLLGRGLAIVRAAGGFGAGVLARKRYNELLEADLRDFLAAETAHLRSGIATVDESGIGYWLGRVRNTELGAPVAASVICIDEQHVSLLMKGPGEASICEIVSGCGQSDWSREAKTILATCTQWARGTRDSVAWGSKLRNLATRLVSGARTLFPEVRWLVIAIDPVLAGLPWQGLIRELDGGIVVSLVPNLSWAAMTHFTAGQTVDRVRLNLVQFDEGLERFRLRLRDDYEILRQRLRSAAVVLAHGVKVPKESRLGGVCFAERPLWIEDWFDMAVHRLCIVHACHAGTAEAVSVSLGDLGGIPGLVLSAGTRLLCAPVAEVPVSAAETLHGCVTSGDGPREFGLRYLHSIRTDPRISLYNLYGFADELIFPSEPAASGSPQSGGMLTGTVTRRRPDESYGFIAGSNGRPYFFHASGLAPDLPLAEVREGLDVDFEGAPSRTRPGRVAAVNVRRHQGPSPQPQRPSESETA